MSPELNQRIAVWRSKAAAGTLTKDEMREAIKVLRQDRIAAAANSDRARTSRAKAEIPDADDLLKEMGL